MQYQTEILRYEEGVRSRHPSPEATVTAAQPDSLSDAGNQIAVLVDLVPQLPYRSREIRSLVMKTYWTSTGSVVARLRRALAAANRHLVTFNRKAPSGSKCAGNITCAVLTDSELFLGQVGAAYAYISHPSTIDDMHPGALRFEIFPKRDRLLIPLGATIPPIIHISYTAMVPGSIGCIATTTIAEAVTRENWQRSLALGEIKPITSELAQTLASRRASGSAILIRAQATAAAQSTAWRQPKPREAPTATVAASLTPIPPTRSRRGGAAAAARAPSPATQDTETIDAPFDAVPVSIASAAARVPSAAPEPEAAQRQATGRSAVQETGTPERIEAQPGAKPDLAPRTRRNRLGLGDRLARLRYRLHDVGESWRQRREAAQAGVTERTTTAERARLRQALRTLLPGRVEGQETAAPRIPPKERASVMGGIALGFLVLIVLITLTKYFQLGGPLRAEELLAQAVDLREQAYDTQESEDWYALLDAASQIVQLDPQNPDAIALKAEAQQAIDILESAAMISLSPLVELGTAPRPRRVLAAGSWLYVLDTASDAIQAYPLAGGGRALTDDSPTTVLRRGQTHLGQVVDHLVDFAWIEPSASYPDGAVFIYSDGGSIFIYEPDLGPGSVSVQELEGDLEPGSITLMATFGERFYLVHRQQNQILMYEPVNGIYSSARGYFAEGSAPDLQLALDIAIDGRVYLLLGDGTVESYYSGSYDPSFQISGLPDADFVPLVMDIDPDVDTGYVYLAETQEDRIVVLDKRGDFVRQYRLPRSELQRIESLNVDETAQVMYLIAENRLYAAPLPTFGARATDQP